MDAPTPDPRRTARIRAVTHRDELEELAPLWRALHRHDREVGPAELLVADLELSWRRRHAQYASWLADGSGLVLVADLPAERAVAYATAHVSPGPDASLAIGERYAELYSLVVAAPHRGSGLGSALLDELDDRLEAMGIADVVVAATVGNDAARRFYEARGFVPAELMLWRLGRGADAAVVLRPAVVSERAALEALQRRSSMHQPLYRAQLAAHPDAIELPEHQITAGRVRVAERAGALAGFAVLLERSGDACELDGLFVEPEQMRRGVGRRLVADAVRMARSEGATRVDVVANPQAADFYAAVGFTRTGEAQTRFGPAPRLSLVVTGPAPGGG